MSKGVKIGKITHTLKHRLHGNMLITSLKEKELYKVNTPIFYDRNAEKDSDEGKKGDKKVRN